MQVDFASRIPLWPRYDPADERALQDVLHSRLWWRGNGTRGDDFEAAFAKMLGVAHVRLVSHGTAALELALAALGVGPEDEVIVPACTFIATASAVLRLGAWPIPVDVEPKTLNIDVALIEPAIGPRTRCVVPVHMAGQAADMPAIMAIAGRHGLSVVEDAAHAHGARAFGSALGAIGDASIFSFQSGKLMTCGEGGAIATSRADIAAQTFPLHSCGRPKGDTEYRHLMATTNMRLTELQVALLVGQLRRLPGDMALRDRNAPIFEARLRDAGLEPLDTRAHVERHGRYMTLAWFDPAAFGGADAATLSASLRQMGVPAFRCFPPVHHTEMFAPAALASLVGRNGRAPDYAGMATPVAERAAREAIWFAHPLLLGDEALLTDVADAVATLRVPLHPARQVAHHATMPA
ncbi:DegT/DnrJ/EryC1/StrS family aminotransferase [Aurantimonas endophytica]|uniref:3-amino-5-hydroxybenzoate synthase n=1 Tax=Aurantimonas endophytica TaxID=1522175 RepID=A0A7W6MNI6_9HYPH|nr:DegT/DnrJ/EryC1/StrS family aminotransferase [Aurantimonas endophytica]MBB4001892.1 3-amino-5-hydroxybenzoate synthase [Aurantimonas endophytica]MCO6402473.1 aminotransferase class I/II-fold pyridoxal phosphate-dependent enzyme [Aurantimonas endophytica]